MDENILPLISYAKTSKETKKTIERIFGARRSIKVEYYKFVESHCAQLRVDDGCDQFVAEAQKDHIYSRDSHNAQMQVDENLMNPTKELDDDNMVNPIKNLTDESKNRAC